MSINAAGVWARVWAVAGLGAVLTGCATDMNERDWIGQTENNARGGVVHLALVEEGARPERPLTDDPRSVISLGRGNWSPTLLVVPVDGVAAHAAYVRHGLILDQTARQRGDYPTVLSSLELSGETRFEQWAESWYNPGIALADLALLPARMYVHPAWREVYTFPDSVWRAPVATQRTPPAELAGVWVNGNLVGGAAPLEAVPEDAAGPAPAAERPETPAEQPQAPVE